MNKPIDPNDPVVKNVMNIAASQQGGAAEQAGLGGPATANASQNAAIGASTNLAMERKQLGLQALGMGTQAGLAQSQFQYGQYLNALNAQNAKNAGVMGTIGTIGGGVIGGYFGGPQGAAAGAQLGGGIGRGFAAGGQQVPYGGGTGGIGGG